MSSKFLDSLSGDAKKRYQDKIQQCGGIDPYALTKADLVDDVGLWPAVTYMDIVNYMVLKTSFVTRDQMRAYKSLEAHAFFTNGWVHETFLKVRPSTQAVTVPYKCHYSGT